MIDLPQISGLAAVLNNRDLLAGVGISILSGTIRGFTGFGSALIYVPLIASVYGPRSAAATLLLIDFVAALPFAVKAAPRCTWREIIPLTAGAIIAVPFGTMALLLVDPTTLRWIMAVLVLVMLALIAAGVHRHDSPNWALTSAIGLVSGFCGGAFQMDGPPVVIFWLGSTSKAHVIRANLMVYFAISGAAMCVSYVASGLVTSRVVALSLLLGLPFGAAMKLGAKVFHSSSERRYRLVAYFIIAGSAIASLPVLDPVLR